MSIIRIASVVEGHGEIDSVPILIRRILGDHSGEHTMEWLRPHRCPRGHLVATASEVRDRAIRRAVEDALPDGSIFVLLDADDDCPVEVAATLRTHVSGICRPRGLSCSVVLAKREFESWFLASPDALRGVRGLGDPLNFPDDPESVRGAKERLENDMESGYYASTVDQPKFTNAFSLAEARANSPSFEYCYSEITRLADLQIDRD